MRKKSVERTELSCHTWNSQKDGILSPQEWINIARGIGVRAIAIMDFQGIEGFKEAAQAVGESCGEAEPGEFNFKVLYGLETVLEDGCLVHLLVQRQEGLAQLYQLLGIAWQGREERPFLRKAEISEHRTGLLVGCPGENGEVYRGILEHLGDACLEEIAGFYDYLSVLPPQHYRLLSTREHTSRSEALMAEDLILKTIIIGKRSGKPVAAAGNVRTASQDWGMFRSSVAYGIQKDEDGDLDGPLPDLLYTEEMLDAFSFLEKELAEEIVIHTPNCLADLCEEIRIFPEDERCLQPILPGAFQTVADLCRTRLQIQYGGTISETVRERMEYEFAILQNNELLCSVLLIGRHLVRGLQEKGYPVSPRTHNSASVHAYSYVAYLLGMTEVDPLVMHIPCEAFRKLDMPDLELTLSVPQECWDECWEDATKICTQIFPQGMVVSYGNKTRWDQKAPRPYRNKGILVPNAAEMQNWMPLAKINGGYMIPYGCVEDFSNLFRLQLWPAANLSLLRRLEESTGTPQSSINVEEAVPLLLRDQTDIPECDEKKAIWKLADPKTMDDIIKFFALASRSGAWWDNGEELVQKKIVPFSEIIGSTDDVFCRLLDAGLDHAFVYQVAEQVERGSALDEECTSILVAAEIPEWFINSCNKIMDLFPKAHWAAIGAIPALKAAWYKTYFPKEYAQAHSELYTK